MNRYLVIHERECPVCEGEGWYFNPDWREANAEYDAAEAAVMAEMPKEPTEDEWYEQKATASYAGWEAIRNFWVRNGYGSNQKRWPPEDEQCHECEGHGLIRKEVLLSDALRALEKGG